MFLTEYDEKKHMKTVYNEGYEEGEQAGERNLLERKIRKKWEQGKTAPVIAEELDEELAVVEELLSSIKRQ